MHAKFSYPPHPHFPVQYSSDSEDKNIYMMTYYLTTHELIGALFI